MNKFLSYISILFIFMFIGVINVDAAEIKKENGNNYKFSWSNLEFSSNSDYGVECSNAQITGGNTTVQKINTIGEIIEQHKTGFVNFTPTGTSGTIKCKIYKDDTGKQEITSAEITLGTTTSKKDQTTTTTTTQAPKSNNANLKSIVVKTSDDIVVNLSPTFLPSVYEYESSVASDVKTVNVEAIMEDSKANLVISNNVNDELIAGENNKITITVTAEDGTKKQYVVNVKREALTADATLSSLTIKEYKDFEFKSDKFNYVIKVKNNINKLTLDYTLSDENAMAKVEGNKDLKDGSKVKITVTAQDGTKKVYTLEISKETEEKKETNDVVVEKNPLIIMGLSIIAFGLIGGIVYVIKK